MKNKFLKVSISLFSLFFLIVSCGVKKPINDSYNLSGNISQIEIENILIKNGYVIELSNKDGIITKWKSTRIELGTFKIKISNSADVWVMKGKIRYEAYRDRELDESIYRESYVSANSDVFVIKHGWEILTKVYDDISK